MVASVLQMSTAVMVTLLRGRVLSERALWLLLNTPTFRTRQQAGATKLSGTDMTGRPGYRTMEMIGGSSALYLACTPCVPLFSTLFNRGGNRRAFRLRGDGGDHFHCTVEPSPGHIRCRNSSTYPKLSSNPKNTTNLENLRRTSRKCTFSCNISQLDAKQPLEKLRECYVRG